MAKQLLASVFFVSSLLVGGSAWAEEEYWGEGVVVEKINGDQCHVKYESKVEPVIALAASGFDLGGADKERLLAEIDEALSLGCSIEEEDSNGTSPLNVAILIGDAKLVGFFLKKGADPKRMISNGRPSVNGKNSFEFAVLLSNVYKDGRRKEVLSVLQGYQK